MYTYFRVALVFLLTSLCGLLSLAAKSDKIVTYQLSGVTFTTGDVSQNYGTQTAKGTFTVDLTTGVIIAAELTTTADPAACPASNPAGFPATTYTASGAIAFLSQYSPPQFSFSASDPTSDNGLVYLEVYFKTFDPSSGDASLYFVQEDAGFSIFDVILRTADDGAVYAFPSTNTVSGQIALEQGVNSAQTIKFVFRPTNGADAFTRTDVLDNNGNFSMPYIPPGTYNLAIKGSKWLQKVVPLDTTKGNISGLKAALLGGDANDDNSVDVIDFSILVGAYNSDINDPGSGYNEAADFNCDGLVDATDFSLLVGDYGQVGDL